MNHEETFARFSFGFGKLTGPRVASLATLGVLSLATLAVVLHLTPERKLLLFDLGVGLVLSGGLYLAARRMITDEARGQHRVLAASLIGVTAAAAVLGIFAVTLAGKPVGLERVVALLTIQTLGAVGGAAVGFLIGFFAAAAVVPARRFVARPAPAVDGLFIGLLAGFGGGFAVSFLPHLGPGFITTSTVVCGICGFRSAKLFERTVGGGR